MLFRSLLIDNFDPELGDAFVLLNWGSLSGEFNQVKLPGLSGELDWDISSLYGTGAISVVPEPGALSLVLLGAVGVFRRRK